MDISPQLCYLRKSSAILYSQSLSQIKIYMSKTSKVIQEIRDIRGDSIRKDTPPHSRHIYGKDGEGGKMTAYKNQTVHSSSDKPEHHVIYHSQIPLSPPSAPDQNSSDYNPASFSKSDKCQTSGPRTDLRACTAEGKRMMPWERNSSSQSVGELEEDSKSSRGGQEEDLKSSRGGQKEG